LEAAGTNAFRRRAAKALTASTSPFFVGVACSNLVRIRWCIRSGVSPLARSALLLRRMECVSFIGSQVKRATGLESTSSCPSATPPPGSAATNMCRRRGRHCRLLFGGRYFRCRQCHGLEYASRNMSPAQRAMHRADRIANRLHDMCETTEPGAGVIAGTLATLLAVGQACRAPSWVIAAGGARSRRTPGAKRTGSDGGYSRDHGSASRMQGAKLATIILAVADAVVGESLRQSTAHSGYTSTPEATDR
jgi:hypothetical protein